MPNDNTSCSNSLLDTRRYSIQDSKDLFCFSRGSSQSIPYSPCLLAVDSHLPSWLPTGALHNTEDTNKL